MAHVIERKNQAESELKFAVARLRDTASTPEAPGHGPQTAPIGWALSEVIRQWRRLCGSMCARPWCRYGNTLLAPHVGLILCVPNCIHGTMLLGEVTQAAAALAAVQGAFNWLVDNYPRLAEWASSASRGAFSCSASIVLRTARIDRRISSTASRRSDRVGNSWPACYRPAGTPQDDGPDRSNAAAHPRGLGPDCGVALRRTRYIARPEHRRLHRCLSPCARRTPRGNRRSAGRRGLCEGGGSRSPPLFARERSSIATSASHGGRIVRSVRQCVAGRADAFVGGQPADPCQRRQSDVDPPQRRDIERNGRTVSAQTVSDGARPGGGGGAFAVDPADRSRRHDHHRRARPDRVAQRDRRAAVRLFAGRGRWQATSAISCRRRIASSTTAI